MPAQPTPNQHHQDILRELIDMGADIARIVHAQAKAHATDPEATPTLTQSFDRVARCVRRTILLARKLDEPTPAPNRLAARRDIIRGVENAIQGKARDDDQARAMHAELLDRLDGPDIEDDIARRPIPEIIAEIAQDLGLLGLHQRPPFPRRTPEAIADLCARAAGQPAPRPPALSIVPKPGPTPGGDSGPEPPFHLLDRLLHPG